MLMYIFLLTTLWITASSWLQFHVHLAFLFGDWGKTLCLFYCWCLICALHPCLILLQKLLAPLLRWVFILKRSWMFSMWCVNRRSSKIYQGQDVEACPLQQIQLLRSNVNDFQNDMVIQTSKQTTWQVTVCQKNSIVIQFGIKLKNLAASPCLLDSCSE